MLFGKTLIPLLTALLLSACDGDTLTPANDGSGVDFRLPEKIRTSLAVDFTQVSGFANVNGRDYAMERFGDRFRARIPNLPTNSDASVSLQFSERLPNGRPLNLAKTEIQRFRIGTVDQTIEITEDQYSYDFDADGDQISNIAERNDGTDPFTPENAGTRTIVVQFNIPQRINDPLITRVIPLMADVTRVRSPPFNSFVFVSGLVSTANNIEVDIRLQQIFQGQPVRIARALLQVDPGNEDVTLNLFDDNFDFSIDDDRDGISNLDELQSGTNPFVAN